MTSKLIAANVKWPAGRPTRLANSRQYALLRDDDEAVRRLNAELTYCGYHVHTATDGAVAWETMSHRDYDLLSTDNHMPKVIVVELLKKIHSVGLALPVIIATGTLPKSEFTRAPWLQPAALLLKPYSPTEFLGTSKEGLRATTSAQQETPPPPNWLNHLADRFQDERL